ncbi:NAD-dependent epimerase/dehydratase family protein [Frankia sp. QA3]|uniref:NAD-dependent epimerase/dehydratase family protein n=1 Tax=Frankia sp. QA3 TaxID=710111 RepID=UPI000269CB19|nr:NAD-dependent epimerase/dehydratase family protein [Frankia sp. QA3]EIV93307.1 nucleoside-diphosphate-sugar epimerase [Frankia sp. QA3]
MTRIALFGATGFIGAACAAALAGAGHEVLPRPARRLWVDGEALTPAPQRAYRPHLAGLAAELDGVGAVVNAAGVAMSAARLSPGLVGGNAAWPRLLADACEQTGVPRLVHVSTAAVQGRSARLDESLRYAPVTPYARSKTLGEQLLRDAAAGGRVEVTLYRPPSVHGPGRRMTSAFAAFCQRWPLVTCGDGNQPVPVALIGNIGAAVAAILAADSAPLVVSHPYEGHTVRTLYETFAPGRPLRTLPTRVVRGLLRAAEPSGQWLPPLSALCRRAELLLFGQGQEPGWLEARGFRLPLGQPAWDEVAAAVHRRSPPGDRPAHGAGGSPLRHADGHTSDNH